MSHAEYLAKHKVEEKLVAAMAAVVEDGSEDPVADMGKKLLAESSGLLGLTPEGKCYASAAAASFINVDNTCEKTPCTVAGTLTEYKVASAGDQKLLDQLNNNVRKCAVCGKPCGFTLKKCNGCNADLPEEIVHTDNIFMAFVYGVEKGDKFPYSISIRKQTEELLVFDDPLALTACHFCAIPTKVWCADWRLLLRKPAEGLSILRKLEEAAWSCIEEQFLTNKAWCEKSIAADKQPKTPEDYQFIRDCVVTGCNFPPSQFQLHIQYFLMPWQPAYYRQFLDKGSLVYKRWFPLKYIKAVLELDDPMEIDLADPLDKVLDKYNGRVSYDKYFAEEEARVDAAHKALATWRPEDFSVVVDPTTSPESIVSGTPPEGMTGKQIIESDKKILHSSGPIRTYYKYVSRERVPEFGRD